MIKQIAQIIAVLATLLGATLGALTITATPANAAPYYGLLINVDDACHLKYGGERHLVSSKAGHPSDASSWFCQRKVGTSNSFSFSVTAPRGAGITAESGNQYIILGGVDMQLYCSTRHPGTIALIGNEYAPWWNAYNWKCW